MQWKKNLGCDKVIKRDLPRTEESARPLWGSGISAKTQRVKKLTPAFSAAGTMGTWKLWQGSIRSPVWKIRCPLGTVLKTSILLSLDSNVHGCTLESRLSKTDAINYDTFPVNFCTWCEVRLQFIVFQRDIQLFQHQFFWTSCLPIELPWHFCQNQLSLFLDSVLFIDQ